MLSVGDLIGARDGHFVFESGYHGTVWLDLDALFARPAQVLPHARALAERLRPYDVEVVCGPFSGGAFLASMVAAELDAALVYSMPPAYDLPPSLRDHVTGRRTAIVDDVINAASAVTKTLTALAAAEVVAIGALMTLGTTGVNRLSNYPLEALEQRPHDLWLPPACPLCAAGAPLDAG